MQPHMTYNTLNERNDNHNENTCHNNSNQVIVVIVITKLNLWVQMQKLFSPEWPDLRFRVSKNENP